MPTPLYVTLVVVLWVVVGVGAALLFLGRRGYRNATWYLVGAVLGPLFVPIAIERGRRTAVDATRAEPAGTDGAVPGSVLVGVDGSPESDQAVRDAARIFGPLGAEVVLVAVVDPDVLEFDDAVGARAWRELLAERAGWFATEGATPRYELRCGQPDRELLRAAETEDAAVLVIGRRGSGLSHRLLGSAARSVTLRAAIPVLLAGPPRTDPRRGRHASASRSRPGS